MLITSWYFDERRCEMRKINLWDLKKLDYDNHEEFLYIKQRLCRDRNGTIPMCLVRNGAHQGFRRKGGGGNTTSKSRGECESFTHQGNKEAIGSLKEIVIIFNDERVKIYARNVEFEKDVVCNGNVYRVDLFYEIERTEPEHYCSDWGGEICIEVFHRCKVDSKQAEDFAIANQVLFEYKVSKYFTFCDNITQEGYDKRVASIAMKIKTNGLYGYMICGTRQKTIDNWKLSKNGNWTAHIGDCNFTIIKSKDDISYGLVYGNGKILWEYNGKKFYSVEDAKINADFVAFKIFNGT